MKFMDPGCDIGLRHVGDKYEIMRPGHSERPELTGRQVGNKWETNGRQV